MAGRRFADQLCRTRERRPSSGPPPRYRCGYAADHVSRLFFRWRLNRRTTHEITSRLSSPSMGSWTAFVQVAYSSSLDHSFQLLDLSPVPSLPSFRRLHLAKLSRLSFLFFRLCSVVQWRLPSGSIVCVAGPLSPQSSLAWCAEFRSSLSGLAGEPSLPLCI